MSHRRRQLVPPGFSGLRAQKTRSARAAGSRGQPPRGLPLPSDTSVAPRAGSRAREANMVANTCSPEGLRARVARHGRRHGGGAVRDSHRRANLGRARPRARGRGEAMGGGSGGCNAGPRSFLLPLQMARPGPSVRACHGLQAYARTSNGGRGSFQHDDAGDAGRLPARRWQKSPRATLC